MKGLANVWLCDPTFEGCGYFGFYKPEGDWMIRRCPSCGRVGTYMFTGDRAEVEVVRSDVV